jgi:hypothetical protein
MDDQNECVDSDPRLGFYLFLFFIIIIIILYMVVWVCWFCLIWSTYLFLGIGVFIVSEK